MFERVHLNVYAMPPESPAPRESGIQMTGA